MSNFWIAYIAIITFGTMLGLVWLIHVTKKQAGDTPEDATMGHTFDGIEELNNPLPKWWLYLFYITIVYGAGYLVYYNFGWDGLSSKIGWAEEGGWTSINQLEHEQKQHTDEFGDVFATFGAMSIEELVQTPKALEMGQQIYLNNCGLCHGKDAKGSHGFPNLTDNDWLFGGAPADILESVTNGRGQAVRMPSFKDALKTNGIEDVANFVLSLSNQEHDAAKAQKGAALFESLCSACHGKDAKGTFALGAPNLTDDVWLYFDSNLTLEQNIKQTLTNGRSGLMPAWEEVLGKDKVKLVSAYVFSLSN